MHERSHCQLHQSDVMWLGICSFYTSHRNRRLSITASTPRLTFLGNVTQGNVVVELKSWRAGDCSLPLIAIWPLDQSVPFNSIQIVQSIVVGVDNTYL